MTKFEPESRDRRTLKTLLDNPSAIREIELQPGDILMVAMELNDKHKKGKTFTWRFFGLVTNAKNQRFVETLVLDGSEREPMTLHFYRENTAVHYIPEGQWPDGVHALRTRALLDGRVDIDLF